METKKGKKVVIIWSIIGIFLLLVSLIFVFFFFKEENKNAKKKLEEQKEQERINLIKDITKHYSTNVITTKKTSLYKKIDNTYKEIGQIKENETLELKEIETLTENDKYLPLKNIEYYIFYDTVSITERKEESKTYKNYIPFNQNVTTTEKTNLYLDNTKIYEINEPINLPLIIKTNEYYYVEYDSKLLGIKKEESTLTDNENQKGEIATDIAVLNYHFFYDETNEQECGGQSICLHVNKFKEQLDYLKQEGFYTMRMNDMYLFTKGEIRLPKKSVLITIDDGWLAEKGAELLNKYEMNATIFLITSAYNKEQYESKYIETHSHGHNLHFPGACPGGQGGPIKCYEEEKLLDDLSQTREKLNNTTVFCYPFYEYNNYAINILQKAGFTMAFIGGNRKVNQNSNQMLLPRYPIYGTTTIEQFKNIVS